MLADGGPLRAVRAAVQAVLLYQSLVVIQGHHPQCHATSSRASGPRSARGPVPDVRLDPSGGVPVLAAASSASTARFCGGTEGEQRPPWVPAFTPAPSVSAIMGGWRLAERVG